MVARLTIILTTVACYTSWLSTPAHVSGLRFSKDERHQIDQSSAGSAAAEAVALARRKNWHLSPDKTKTIFGALVDRYTYIGDLEDEEALYFECFKGMELQSCQHCAGTMYRNKGGEFNCSKEDTLLRDMDSRARVQNPFGGSVYSTLGGGDTEGWENIDNTVVLDGKTAYAGDIDYKRAQQPWCLQCCSNNDPQPGSEIVLTWDLYCPIDGMDRPGGMLPYTNFDNFQFRFARKRSLEDLTVITCDLLRTPEEKDLVLQGYELTINIVDYFGGVDGTDFWVGVESCESKLLFEPVWTENSCRDTFNTLTMTPECACENDPCVFREKITMIRAPGGYSGTDSQSETHPILTLTIWMIIFSFAFCGVCAYYTGRCGQWCDYTDGARFCKTCT